MPQPSARVVCTLQGITEARTRVELNRIDLQSQMITSMLPACVNHGFAIQPLRQREAMLLCMDL